MAETVAENIGTLRPTPSGYLAQFSIGGGVRKGVILRTCKTEDEANARKLAIAKLVARLRESGHDEMIANVIRDSGKLADSGMVKLARLVERIAAGKEPGLARRAAGRREGITVSELAKLWTSGELAAQYPDHVKAKRTSKDDARVFKWMNKVRLPDGGTFGALPIAELTLDDCDHVMSALPSTLTASASRRQYAQALRKLVTYAVFPLRILTAHPIPAGWLPKIQSGKAKQWIYPAEDAALMACIGVALVHRLLFGFLAREGMRSSEALALTWADCDLERGVVRLDVNKTNDPRAWAMGADVVRALAAWKAIRAKKAKKIPNVFPRALLGPAERLARKLREGLVFAGVTRPELVEEKPGRMILRAHDLRGSFVTAALATGHTEAWVTDRTGHKSSAMVYRYKRAARTAAELSLGWFEPLDEAIPELSPKSPRGCNQPATGGTEKPERSRGGSETPAKGAVSRHAGTEKEPFKIRGPQGRPGSSPGGATTAARGSASSRACWRRRPRTRGNTRGARRAARSSLVRPCAWPRRAPTPARGRG